MGSIILAPELGRLGGPVRIWFHWILVVGGGADVELPSRGVGGLGLLINQLRAETWVKLLPGKLQLKRLMKKWLLTTLRSALGPHGPLKPELLKLVIPEPCVPSNATISFSLVVPPKPTVMTLSMVCHESDPSGRVPQQLSASKGYVVGRPWQNVCPLGTLIVGMKPGLAVSLLMP